MTRRQTTMMTTTTKTMMTTTRTLTMTTTTTMTMTKTMTMMMITMTTTKTTMTMEWREEARWQDERFQQRIKTSGNVDVKTDNNNVDVNKDVNGAAGGGMAAQQTKTMTRQN